VRAFLRYSERRGAMLADSVTYRALFSIFAAVLLGFSVAALWLAGNTDAWAALIAAVDRAVPGLVGPVGSSTRTGSRSLGLSIAGAIAASTRRRRDRCDRSLRRRSASCATARRRRAVLARDAPQPRARRRRRWRAAGVRGRDDARHRRARDRRGWFGASEHDPAIAWGALARDRRHVRLDAVAIAVLFRVLGACGIRPPCGRAPSSAPSGSRCCSSCRDCSSAERRRTLLASFAALIALLLWINLSAQVILIATAYIFTLVREGEDRVRERFGASTFAQRRVQQAEDAVARLPPTWMPRAPRSRRRRCLAQGSRATAS
jgi:membrane protein